MQVSRPIALVSTLALAVVVAAPTFGQAGPDAKPSDEFKRQRSRERVDRNRPGESSKNGQALDSNLQIGGSGVNRPAQKVDYAARNLIVTHDVAGGRGFRGAVGYLAPTDFRGTTGGDSTQTFRNGSAFSDATYFTAGFPQDRYNVAQGLAIYEYRRDATPPAINPTANALENRIRLDKAGSNLSLARQAQRDAEPLTFASAIDNTKREVEFTASSVQGVRKRRLDDPIDRSELPVFEKARARRDLSQGTLAPGEITTEFKSPLQEPADARFDTMVAAPSQPGATDPRPSAYDEIVQRVVARYGDRSDVHIDADPRAIERARTELAKVRGALGMSIKEPASRTSLPEVPGKPDRPERPGLPDRTPDDMNAALERPNARPTDAPTPENETPEARLERERVQRRLTITEAAQALRHHTKVSDLSTGDRTRIDELVRDGQQALTDGEFFKSGRAFEQALLLNPDNPLLTVGKAHADLGAGLYLSSALALRTLFSEHPEMIDTRYEPKLLPNETRLRIAVESLSSRLTSRDADGYGLTLAYLGHQLGERALVEEGLAAIKGSMENDLLRELLEQIWLGKSTTTEKQDAPKPAPTPAR